MSKRIYLTSALALASFSACAQSSVTVGGTADASVRTFDSGGVSVKKVGSGGYGASQLYFKGSENLGGGYSANFHIETDVNMDTGAPPSPFWSRQSWVGIKGGMGEVRLGRDYTPGFNLAGGLDPFSHNGIAYRGNLGNYAMGTNAQTGIRAANSVSYATPNTLGGFQSKVMVAPSEGVGGGKFLAGRIGYSDETVTIAFSSSRTDVGPAGTTIATGKLKQNYVAGTWTIGQLKLFGQFLHSRHDVGAGLTQTNVLVGFHYNIGFGTIRGAYEKVGKDLHANQIAVGYIHDLSKRTALYATAARIKNESGNAAFALRDAPATAVGLRQTSTGAEAGIRHLF